MTPGEVRDEFDADDLAEGVGAATEQVAEEWKSLAVAREKSMMSTLDWQRSELTRLRALLSAIAVLAREPSGE